MSEESTDPAVRSVARNRRSDAMFVAAYLAVLGLVYVVVFEEGLNEYAQGVITLALGNFIGYLTAMYNFETGTTRGAQAKDETIKSMVATSQVPKNDGNGQPK